MRIVQGDEVPLARSLEHRGGTFYGRILLEGREGTPGNFQLSVGQSGGDFYSPRHRHNFEQFRFQIDGTLDFARDGKMRPGMLGYFPEGVAYGPQSQDPEEKPLVAVLQFGGPSGSGYLSRDEVKAGMVALEQFGAFKDGVFRRRDDADGRRNSDAYQAIWEHVYGQAMEYPKGRYDKPVFMDCGGFQWVPLMGRPGVSEKLLGIFTERRTSAALVRIEPGATFEGQGETLFLAVSGTGTVEGQPLRILTAVHLGKGEAARFSASSQTVLLSLGLPDLEEVRLQTDAGRHQRAAAE